MIVGTMPKQVEYALMALADMQSANPGQLFSARELCDRHQVPFDVMSKTMQRLGRSGILRSVQGVHGGYQIIKDLSGVSLLDLMESVLGEVAAVNCLKKGVSCPLAATCNVSGPMRVLDARLHELYATISLMSLIDGSADQ
ncbi:MAG: Rrf2 family transcriptional regulator [Kiritimatiellales bacterium]|nr:Rrf2 family transcriptional regulator [Kiritimatiellales bacterium]